MSNHTPVVLALGCSGPVATHIVNGFLAENVALQILARSLEAVASRYAGAEVIPGSMANTGTVASAVQDVDAAFLITPMGMRNDPSSEIAIAKRVIDGAKQGGLKHLIYTSVLDADKTTGVGILDAKFEIENLIKASGVPYTILRCGSYLEDVFDPRLELLNKGKFLFPISRQQPFSYTAQADIPRFVVRELLEKNLVLNKSINFIEPDVYRIPEIEKTLSTAAGFPIKGVQKFPTFYLFRACLPYFNLTKNRFSSIIPLMQHFDLHGYTSSAAEMQSAFPGFHMTTLHEHLGTLWQTQSHRAPQT